MDYPVKLAKDDNGTYLVTSPDFSELVTFGEDKDDALSYAVSAFEEAIAARISHNEDIPEPSNGKLRVYIPALTAAKAMLYQSMRRQGVHKAELARRLNQPRQQVDRLVNVKHKSKLDQIERAFAALDVRIEIRIAG